ncbi:unknown [Clostridium sp. CAG:411]|nr:unknown [Clostridium sp. CAG:411]
MLFTFFYGQYLTDRSYVVYSLTILQDCGEYRTVFGGAQLLAN